jgi:hypothetical protein
LSYVLSIVLAILNSLFAFGKKNSKILTILLIVFLWILYWGNLQNPDYFNYLRSYNNAKYIDELNLSIFFLEYGFIILQRLISYFNIDYTGFLMIISAIGLILIYITVTRFTKNTNYVFLLYFFMPFFLDVVQIRNFLAMSIMIFSIRFLFNGRKVDKIKFIITILFAASIHLSAIVYLPMIFICKSNKKNIVKSIVIVSILFSLIILINNNIIIIMGNLIYNIVHTRQIKYWFEVQTRYGYLLFFGIQLMNFLMISIAKNIVLRNQKYSLKFQNSLACEENEKYKFVELAYWINVYAFAFFPLYILATIFTRLMRNLLILNYIAFSLTNESFKKDDSKRILFNLKVVIYVLILFLIDLYITRKDTVLITILENNLIFR